jgi:hypothetical protein
MEATMARKITVVLEDDLDGGPADETVRFKIGGAEYEIDLSAKNTAAFCQQLAPCIEHARRVGSRQRQVYRCPRPDTYCLAPASTDRYGFLLVPGLSEAIDQVVVGFVRSELDQ